MLLRNKRQQIASPQPDAAALNDPSVGDHADAEVWRAIRYRRPLTAVALRPQLFSGEQPTRHELLLATKGVKAKVRRTDRVGLFQDHVVVSLLPETDELGARSTANRVAGEMTLRTSAGVHRTWVYGVAARRENAAKGEQLIAAAIDDLRDRQS